ncbi:IclR family transcriptional regulator [Nocardioides mesophilus]|uniref:IclR family transcriptional regulator n=1 Tax=Nocardioides mesophilus TaxID=433659 RepID=A0A7G9R8G1_9ACTN|nr:IclR family transcriptional regulator [Nocardioides mesophilus]QNN51886.1 IclR family transcriptional regulator [Nocardioides mesophilus]
MPPATVPAGLRRDLDILDALAQHAGGFNGALGVSRVADLVGREKSQVSRALAALAKEGLVERDPETLGYRLGWRIYALAARTFESRLVTVATPYLRAVVSKVQETTVLCVLRGNDLLTVASEAPAHAFRGVGWEGVTVPAAATSAGRVLVSDWEEPAIRAWFTPAQLAVAGAHPKVTTPEELLEELTRIRANGYATVDEEFEHGVVGCSAPVRDFNGRIVAAINITGPKGRLGDRLDMAGRYIAGAAQQLTERLVAEDGRS